VFAPDNPNIDGRPVYQFCTMHDKEGKPNKQGIAALKRFFEAIAPASASSEDADTDELIDGHFLAETYIDTYKKEGSTLEQQTTKLVEVSVRAVS
jgi:hypothetical protein